MTNNHPNRNRKQAQEWQDGYGAGFMGKKDKSEMYFHTWGKKAAEDYSAGYRKGEADSVALEGK